MNNEFDIDFHNGTDQNDVLSNERTSSVDASTGSAQDATPSKFDKFLDTVTNISTQSEKLLGTAQDYGTTKEGYSLRDKDIEESKRKAQGVDVKILGMEPLVFSVVAIALVIGLGIAITQIGKKAVTATV